MRAVAALEERSRRADLERRARAALVEARDQLSSGHPADALALLQRFDPPHPLITDALLEMRARVAAIEETRRVEKNRTDATPAGGCAGSKSLDETFGCLRTPSPRSSRLSSPAPAFRPGSPLPTTAGRLEDVPARIPAGATIVTPTGSVRTCRVRPRGRRGLTRPPQLSRHDRRGSPVIGPPQRSWPLFFCCPSPVSSCPTATARLRPRICHLGPSRSARSTLPSPGRRSLSSGRVFQLPGRSGAGSRRQGGGEWNRHRRNGQKRQDGDWR